MQGLSLPKSRSAKSAWAGEYEEREWNATPYRSSR